MNGIKKIFAVITLALLTANSLHAGSYEREMESFRRDVQEMKMPAKMGLIGANLASLAWGCGVSSGLGTVLAALGDTLPFVYTSMVVGMRAEDVAGGKEYSEFRDETALAHVGGSLVGLVVDLFQTPLDWGDGKIDDGARDDYTKSFNHIRTAYKSTIVIAKASFSKESRCRKSIARLDILFGTESPDDEIDSRSAAVFSGARNPESGEGNADERGPGILGN